MLTHKEYKEIVEFELNDKSFRTFGCYSLYKGFLITYNHDLPDCVSDKFDPMYQKRYIRRIGDKIDYFRYTLTFDYKNDIEKYKDDIIKYIDRKIEKHKK